MSRTPEIQSVIEQAVAQALERALPKLREEIVRSTTEKLQATSVSGAMDLLNEASASIQEAVSQAEILRKLLEGSAHFAGRAALFVVKGGAATGWQGIGFEDNEFVRSITLNGSSGLAVKAMQSRIPTAGSPSDFDAAFLSSAGRPKENKCLVLPLVVKDKVAALIYADGGTASEGRLDSSALNILNRCAANWLEVIAFRKSIGSVAEEPQAVASVAAAAAGTAAAVAPAAPAPVVSAAAAVSAEDADLHRKAKRFAKLLVEEIKLYNQAKVTEGRAHGDLYERLKEDIEKSRATFDKRYGESPVASANYFTEELIRILADNDISLMGANFPR